LSEKAGICLCLAEETLDADLRAIERVKGRIDLVELRVDHLAPAEQGLAGRLPGRAGLPAILTVRRTRDGGRFTGDERDRVALLGRLAEAGFRYVDLEEDLDAPGLDARIRGAGGRIIRSFHDFQGVPADLSPRLARLARGPDEIPKAAVMPKTCAELTLFLDAAAAAVSAGGARERILLAMGDLGFPTRVLASRLGSAWCYSSPAGRGVAPGHVDPVSLEDGYGFRAIGAGTAVYGVMGNPVMHSGSPMIHNRGFARLGLDAVYLPFLVPDLDGFWGVADRLGIRGLSVTVPHKQALLSRLRNRDRRVEAAGACNTITRDPSGGWSGTNTDIDGFLAPLKKAWGGSVPCGAAATVIGAGGAARAVVYALRSAGARVLVLNRTVGHARSLAAAFSVGHAGLDAEGIRRARDYSDLVVQTTSVGMAPDTAADPAPGFTFTGRELVYELIYAPGRTALVQRALAAGCRIVYGRQMLLEQARGQFLLFTGREYPEELMEELECGFD
jgi:3-dehydroquinate dehydratase / shikimate dehydrogenase